MGRFERIGAGYASLGGKVKLWEVGFWAALCAAGALIAGYTMQVRMNADRNFADEVRLAQASAEHIQHDVVLFTEGIVPPRSSFAAVLQGMGFQAPAAARVIASVKPVFDLRRVRAGNRVSIGRTMVGEFRELRYRIDPDRMLRIEPKGNDFAASIETVPSTATTTGVSGAIHGSLFEGVTAAGEKPELAMRLADIFGWDLDFYTDPRPGDTFRLVVEKKTLANGELVSYGRILAAEYNNNGRVYRTVLFHDPAGAVAYYTPEGKSMKKAFLHSPLKFAAPITSHFSNSRFHPILKEYRPHLGIDYGAPTGTPVQSIGEGRVIFAGPKGGAGNLIHIQHTNGYETYYMHLSRILVHAGEHVGQGDRIGLVGMTGLATGPHLDFRIERHGEFLNFERLPLPPSEPVAKRDWDEFAAARDSAMQLLSQLSATLASNPATSAASAIAPVPAH
jgi:murein DD-endopeptidase MepM/ murein hydrolase activator NlpD